MERIKLRTNPTFCEDCVTDKKLCEFCVRASKYIQFTDDSDIEAPTKEEVK